MATAESGCARPLTIPATARNHAAKNAAGRAERKPNIAAIQITSHAALQTTKTENWVPAPEVVSRLVRPASVAISAEQRDVPEVDKASGDRNLRFEIGQVVPGLIDGVTLFGLRSRLRHIDLRPDFVSLETPEFIRSCVWVVVPLQRRDCFTLYSHSIREWRSVVQHRYRFAAACFLVGALPAFVAATDSEMTDDSLEETAAPAEFVLNQLATHRVVFFGESHWVADEVELVVRLVPQLPGIGTRTLAVEVFPASMQQQLDDVIAAETWNESDAVAVLRAAEMPHGEYLDIIQSVWALNHDGGESLALVAMGPGPNWRETLPPTDDYESFMVRRIENALEQRGGSVLAYLGLHHAFTRYVQPESTEDGRAWRFMVRTGNLLWWKMGEAVSAIGTHHPFQCRKDDSWAYCVPFDGAVDRAFADLGRGATGFAVAGSPFADLRFAPNVVYAAGYPDLRFVDFIDGWIWFAPIGQLRQTRIIPLEVYAPDEASLASVRKANPFDGGALTQEELESLWHDETEAHTKPILESRWKGVLNRHQ